MPSSESIPIPRLIAALDNVDKEMLAFLHERSRRKPDEVLRVGDLEMHFYDVEGGDFQARCQTLQNARLIGISAADEVSLSPAGAQVVKALVGQADSGEGQPAAATVVPPTLEEHLVWDLSKVTDHEKASQFAMSFRQSLCVFSPPVKQLYSNYNIIVPKDNQKKLIILPNPYADYDTFNRINGDAAVPTRMFITPGANGELNLQIPLKSGTWHALPLQEGLNLVQHRLGDVPFLPVLAKGDLREVQPSKPVMHLHRLILSRIEGRSNMELRSIRKTIQDKLIEHYGFTPA